ncbi:hypothetical protein FHS43_000117 [Streptosporangium becharense]|uniref:DUF4097 domain-containing protein n=1 Tax=Streptosporangium becharense TaxID=1816182 RepID=A0A7W9IGH4_9ACTN|nr:DUF4097 family beta strand repeat-containing protein [Streptosporangium becharense]MBB2908871.1 hypothetical protein [Streptosporangium becharense]MBB5820111.1 hypothetical protein [Streptosporangium becharense]
MTTRSRARTVWIIAGTMLTALSVSFVTASIWVDATKPPRMEETSSSSKPFTAPKIVVDVTGHLDVHIVAGADGLLRTEQSLVWYGDRPRYRPSVTERWEGQTLRLDATCPHVNEHVCETTYTLALPADTHVEVTGRSGIVSVRDVRGDVRLTTTTGGILVNDTRGTLWVRSQKGGVWGNGLRSVKADVETGMGDISLDFAEAPSDVKSVVRTAGDVEVRVPESEKYNIQAKARFTTVGVPSDPAAEHRITALTGEGESRITPYLF